jgi:REP element-mobilizing transposase RayT
MPPRSRHPLRLPEDHYLGPLAAHVTLVTRQRLPLFDDDALALTCVKAIETSAARYAATVHAYCLMPDHLHVLIEITDGISLESVIHHFKTVSGYALKRLTGETPWQNSYYDHILRREEALEDVAAYIWMNPVTAGLVREEREYAWSGPRDSLVRA